MACSARFASASVFGILCCLPCVAQDQGKVTQEKVEKTSKRRVTLAVPGRPPNRSASLRVECLHSEETVQFVVEETDQFSVVLEAGAVENPAGGVISLRLKFDDRPAASHEWMELPNHQGYAYLRYPGSASNRNPGLSPEARQLLEDARVQKDTVTFLGELLTAKTVQVESQDGAVLAQFNLAKLRPEFDNNPECKAYYRLSK
jgi:hypothetical protein